MKRILLLALSILLFYACKKETSGSKEPTTEDQEQVASPETDNDTIIMRRSTENAGTFYYFPIVRKDTILFEVFFTDVAEGSRIAEIQYQHAMTYSTQYKFLRLILKKASEEASFSKLRYIDLNTLPETGDLAIAVTSQLLEEYENLELQLSDYKKVSDMLMRTKLTSDFNALLQPYQMRVGEYDLEKVFLIDRKYLWEKNLLETPPGDIPDKILDAIVRIKLESLQ